jgi:hypothetical protein
MAGLDISPDGKHLIVDLRGYSASRAVAIATEKVSEAWQNGFSHITFVHGPVDPGRLEHVAIMRAIAMKWRLRKTLSRGDWERWVYSGPSPAHAISSGDLSLAVRPNPSPRNPPTWSALPSVDDEERRAEAR